MADASFEAERNEQPVGNLTKPPKGNVLAQAWLVLLLAAAFAASLAAVERSLGPRISQNKLNETLAQIPSLVPEASRGVPDDKVIAGTRVFRALDKEGQLVGWVVPGKGQGFADKIELIVGLDREAETLTGVYVLDQKETPALGDNISTPDFQARFRGFSTEVTLDARQAPTDLKTGVVKAITGATISSDAVCTIVNNTITQVKDALRKEAKGGS